MTQRTWRDDLRAASAAERAHDVTEQMAEEVNRGDA